MAEHESKVKFRNEINENTKLSLRIVAILVLFIAQAEAVVIWECNHVNSEIASLHREVGDAKNQMVSEKQERDWIDNARDANANKGVVFPRLPDKSAKLPETMELVKMP